MAFKHNAGTMMSRYNQHQSNAKARISRTMSAPGYNVPSVSQGKLQTDVRNTHAPLPRQGAPGTNKNQTIQKDINTGTKGAVLPNQNVGLNKRTLQSDLESSRGGVHKPGAR